MPSIGNLHAVRVERRALGRLAPAEGEALVVIGATIGSWIDSSWVPALDLTLVGAGAAARFLPGVGRLTWKPAERGIGWDAPFLQDRLLPCLPVSAGGVAWITVLMVFLLPCLIGGA